MWGQILDDLFRGIFWLIVIASIVAGAVGFMLAMTLHVLKVL